MITGVHHVSFTVSDIERSLRFYRDGLGFEVLNDRTVSGPFPEKVSALPGAHMRIIHLKGHDQGLELIQYYQPEGNAPAPKTCDVGSAHICYIVDDIDGEIEKLRDCGARFLSPADLTLLEPVADPAEVNPGETVSISLPFQNTGPISPTISAEVFSLGPSRLVSFPATAGATTTQTVRFTVPQQAAPGSYDIRVIAWDPNNPNVALISEEVLGVSFRNSKPMENTCRPSRSTGRSPDPSRGS